MSTIEKTLFSYINLIAAGEKVLKIIPKGTHDWNKFINSIDLKNIIQENDLKVINI